MVRDFKFRAWCINETNFKFNIQNEPDAEKYFSEKSRFMITQFTGLKDREGREIYEGDIIAINNQQSSLRLPVKFGRYSFDKFIGECGEISPNTELYGFYVENEYVYIQMLNENVIVVGNIFDIK